MCPHARVTLCHPGHHYNSCVSRHPVLRVHGHSAVHDLDGQPQLLVPGRIRDGERTVPGLPTGILQRRAGADVRSAVDAHLSCQSIPSKRDALCRFSVLGLYEPARVEFISGRDQRMLVGVRDGIQ